MQPKIVNKRLCLAVSHMHGDHVLGIPGLLLSLGLSSRTRELMVLGPRGIRGFVRDVLRYIGAMTPYAILFHEVRDGSEGEFCGVKVRVALGRHTATNYAYRLDGREKPGRFHPERAMALGVPRGPLWKRLQNGFPVTVDDKIVEPKEVVEPSTRGASIGYSGDTRPSRKLVDLFRNVDVLISEATYLDEDRGRALENLHSTASEAARLAAEAGARHLILTHFSSRYKDPLVLLEEARRIFPRVYLAREGRRFLLTPEDLLSRDEPFY